MQTCCLINDQHLQFNNVIVIASSGCENGNGNSTEQQQHQQQSMSSSFRAINCNYQTAKLADWQTDELINCWTELANEITANGFNLALRIIAANKIAVNALNCQDIRVGHTRSSRTNSDENGCIFWLTFIGYKNGYFHLTDLPANGLKHNSS